MIPAAQHLLYITNAFLQVILTASIILGADFFVLYLWTVFMLMWAWFFCYWRDYLTRRAWRFLHFRITLQTNRWLTPAPFLKDSILILQTHHILLSDTRLILICVIYCCRVHFLRWIQIYLRPNFGRCLWDLASWNFHHRDWGLNLQKSGGSFFLRPRKITLLTRSLHQGFKVR